MNNFSYKAYIKLIETIKEVIPLVDFAQIKAADERFFILRHDVEFSVEKAYELAKIEHDFLKISSSYFFQLRNYTYNPLATSNLDLIKKMADMGHKIGLHVNGCDALPIDNIDGMKIFIKNDITLLHQGLGIPIDRFSFHRPSHHLLELNITINNVINTYDKKFFHLYKNKPTESLKSLNVSYFSDSEHRWKYGNPLSILEKPIKKIQLLIHPYSWSKKGLDNVDNFKTLIQSKQQAMRQAINDECRHFPHELL